MYRLHQPDRDPEPIKEILARLFTAKGWGRRQARLQIERAWEEAAGVDHAEHTRVLGFRRGVLEIEVDSATLMHELVHFHKGRLLKALKRLLPSEPPREVKFRPGTW